MSIAMQYLSPWNPNHDLGMTSVPTIILDAAGEKVAFILQAPKTGNIISVSFVTETVTVSDTLKIGIYTVNTSTGEPTVTAYGGMVAGTVSNPVSNTGYTVTLATPAAAVCGDYIAVVIEFNSYVAGNLKICRGFGSNEGFPYMLAMASSAWTKLGSLLNMYLTYTGGEIPWIPQSMPLLSSSSGVVNFTGASTPDEYAIKITPVVNTQLRGVYGPIAINETSYMTLKLYDASNNVLGSNNFYGNVAQTISARWRTLLFPTPYTLLAGNVYRISFITVGCQISLYRYTFMDANSLSVMPLGNACVFSYRTDGGGWTDVNGRIHCALIFDDVSIGSGGLLLHPGMLGGMHG
jgi:hypothetical protein